MLNKSKKSNKQSSLILSLLIHGILITYFLIFSFKNKTMSPLTTTKNKSNNFVIFKNPKNTSKSKQKKQTQPQEQSVSFKQNVLFIPPVNLGDKKTDKLKQILKKLEQTAKEDETTPTSSSSKNNTKLEQTKATSTQKNTPQKPPQKISKEDLKN